MTEQERRERLIVGLRECADFLESHPNVPAPRYGVLNYFATRDQVTSAARAASWEKEYLDEWFYLRRRFGEDLRLEINIEREQICRKVPTGTTVIPAKPAQPEQIVETFEWVCEEASLLKEPAHA